MLEEICSGMTKGTQEESWIWGGVNEFLNPVLPYILPV